MDGARSLRLSFFGDPRMTVGATPAVLRAPPRTFPLFALLVLEDGAARSRDEVAERLWPESDAEEARANLRRHLHYLEGAFEKLGVQLPLVRTKTTIALDPSAIDEFDVRTFERALAGGDLEGAAAAYTGDLLAPLGDPWVLLERERLRVRAIGAFERLIARERARGDVPAALRFLGAALRLEPWREELVRTSMLLHHEAGERAEALHAYRTFADHVRNELQAEPLPATVELYERIATVDPPRRKAGRLPADVTTFVGRSREIAAIDELVRERRLITLVGPPGVGKTRLALRAASDAAQRFDDGAWFVDLTAVDGNDLVEAAILEALEMRGERRTEPTTLESRVAAKTMLVVLDNCEHIAPAIADAATRMLASGGDVRIIATSRVVLKADGEAIFRVEPMHVPPASATREEILDADAVRLFLDRARSVRGRVPLAAATLDESLAICRRLDGIPLALELAAARLRSLTIPQLAQTLGERFRILASDVRSRQQHHRTLLATYDWSFDLLDERERRLFRRLAVFAGGWTAHTAAAICFAEDERVDDYAALDAISALVDKSLVAAPDVDGITARYDFLESTREYARHLLEADPAEGEATRRHHACFFAHRFAAMNDELRGARAHERFPELDAETENVRVALVQLIDSGVDCALGLRLALAVSRFWVEQRRSIDLPAFLERALQTDDLPKDVRLEATIRLATIAERRGDLRRAVSLYETTSALATELDRPDVLGRSLIFRAMIERTLGRLERAREHAQAATAFFEQRGDRYAAAYANTASGFVAVSERRFADAREAFARALERFAALEARSDYALGLINLCSAYFYDGALDAAWDLALQGIEAGRATENRLAIANGRIAAARVAAARRDIAGARAHLIDLAPLVPDLAEDEITVEYLEAVAIVACDADNLEASQTLLAAAHRMRDRRGAPRHAIDEPYIAAVTSRLERELPDHVARLAAMHGRDATLEGALALAAATMEAAAASASAGSKSA